MKSNQSKIKLFIFLAITFILFLLVSSVALLVSISATQKTIKQQKAEIEKLENQIEYYKQLENQESPDYEITEEE